jgi:hypothetical protein
VYRHGWRAVGVISLVAALASALAAVALTQALRWIAFPEAALLTGVLGSRAALLAVFYEGFFLQQLAGGTATVLLAGSLTALSRRLLEGEASPAAASLRDAMRRLPSLGAIYLLLILLLLGLALLTAPLLLLAPVGIPAAVIATALWLWKPGLRRRGVLWVMVLGAPFGLVLYWAGRWSLAFAEAVARPLSGPDALRTSSERVRGRWLPVAACLAAAALVTFAVRLGLGLAIHAAAAAWLPVGTATAATAVLLTAAGWALVGIGFVVPAAAQRRLEAAS